MADEPVRYTTDLPVRNDELARELVQAMRREPGVHRAQHDDDGTGNVVFSVFLDDPGVETEVRERLALQLEPAGSRITG